jgi:hypothetical protein
MADALPRPHGGQTHSGQDVRAALGHLASVVRKGPGSPAPGLARSRQSRSG